MITNHHTHTVYSDGHARPEAYIEEAVKQRFDLIGFTEHSPLPFDNTFSFRPQNRTEYLGLKQELKRTYSGSIRICFGFEMDFIPGLSEDFSVVRKEYELDYLIGSVHLVRPDHSGELWFTDGPHYETYDEGIQKMFGGDARKAVTTYFRQINRMIETQDFEIIGHFDKIKMHNMNRYFREDEGWYRSLVNETIELIQRKGLIVEVNTRGIYKKRSDTTYPGPEILKELCKRNIPVMVNSDAHDPHELSGAFTEAFELLAQAGIREVVYFNEGSWETTSPGQLPV